MARLVRGLLVLTLVLVAGSVSGDDKPEPKLRGQLYPNWKRLALTEEQVQRVYKVQNEYRAKIENLEQQIKNLKKEERTAAEKILTPAQKARLKELSSTDTEPVKPALTPPAKDKPIKD